MSTSQKVNISGAMGTDIQAIDEQIAVAAVANMGNWSQW
jgi:hypothetical protein